MESHSKDERYTNGIMFISFLLIAFIVQYLATKSSPFYVYNDWVDPNAYIDMGRGWLSGQIPYRDIFDHKGPLLYLFYMAGLLINSSSFAGIYIIQSLFFACSLFFLYKIASLFIDKQYAYMIPILFIPIFCSLNKEGGSAEEFIQTLQIIFLYIFFRFYCRKIEESDTKFIFLAGIIIGAILLIKFNIIFFCLALLIPIIGTPIINRNRILAIKYILIITIGVACIVVPFLIYFMLNRSLNDFIQSYILFNKTYGDSHIIYAFLGIGTLARNYIFCNLFIILGTVGFILKYKSQNRIYEISLLLAVITTYFSIYSAYSTHYYSYIPLSVFSILFFICIFSKIQSLNIKNINKKLILLMCVFIALSLSLIKKRKMIKSHNDNIFPIECAEYIQKKNGNTAKILQLSLDRGLLFLTNSKIHYKYFYKPNINYSRYPEIYNSHIKYINSAQPPHFVYYEKYITIKKMTSNESTNHNYLDELLVNKYKLVKEHVDYEKWPATGQYLYELIKY